MKIFLSIASLALLLALKSYAATSPNIVSKPGQLSITGHGDSFAPTFSPDGRFIVFVSRAKNLATNGMPSPWLDVFLRDLDTGRTELVSVTTNGVGGGNGNSSHASVSSNGLFVTFQSSASNLVSNDTNGFGDVFLRNMISGTTTLVSFGTNGANANGGSSSPSISDDGRRIVYETFARNIFPNDTNWDTADIVLYDRLPGTNLLVSIDSRGSGSGIAGYFSLGGGGSVAWGYSANAAFSDDGRWIVFASANTNLVANTRITNGGVFVRDVDLGVTYWASAGIDDPNIRYAFLPPTISADGKVVFFTAPNSPSTPTHYRYDLVSGTNSLVATNIALDPFTSPSANGRYEVICTSSSLSVFDSESGAFEVVCGQGLMPEAVAWRGGAISSNGQWVSFAARTNAAAPWCAYVLDRQSGNRQVVSLSTNGVPAQIEPMCDPVISRDGRRIAFESRAANIVPGDLNNATDIFVRDLSNNTTICVSAAAVAPTTPALASSLRNGSATALGRVIAFTSFDHSLDLNDDNTWRSAFIHDRVSGTNRVLATAATRALGTSRLTFNPIISTNGRYAAWYEVTVPPTGLMGSATNLFWLDLQTGAERVVPCSPMSFLSSPQPALTADGQWVVFSATMPGTFFAQLFRRNLLSPSPINELLSYKRGDRSSPGTGSSFAGKISPDGKWVVFTSQSTDVVTNSIGLTFQIIARDLASGEAHWVSTDGNGQFISSPGSVSNFVISGNSRYVFVQAKQFSYPNANDVYRHDLKTGNRTNLLACTGCLGYSTSDDGNIVAYLNLNSLERGVWIRDLRSNNATLINPIMGTADLAFTPRISADGRYVVFASATANSVANDINNAADIFVYDRTTQASLLVSRNASGAPGNASSSQPMLAPDGRTILFTSSANDLVTDDFNNARDIFVVRLGGEDSDLDGMDDDWEMAYFNTLARDGSGDSDGDGATDLHEFQAGTDPTNNGSILRVITVAPVNGTNRLVLWQAQSARRYRVEFKNELTDAFWDELGAVQVNSSTGSLQDSASTARRIYRVVLVP